MKVHPFLCLLLAHSVAAALDPRQGVRPLPTDSQPQPSTQPASTVLTTPSTTPTQTTLPTTPGTTTDVLPTTTTQSQTSTTGTTQQTTSNTPSSPTSTRPPTQALPPAVSETTNAEGVTITITPTDNTSPTAAPTNTSSSNEDNDGGGLSTGSIIGMSVAAGVAVIGIIGFFIWKFTRKRFSDFDDNEAIKWPELNNTHSGSGPESHALPARETGRSGFDSEGDLTRVNSTSNYSTPDFGAGGPDPYAVPPLPHLNPNQPYRDDPTATSGYYDPYRGPVPGTLEHGVGDWQPEAYPMTQFGGPGRGSPAPDFRYPAGHQTQAPTYGTNSPVPQLPYGGRASPGPQAAYGGRASPSPHPAYSAGRASPGLGTAYGAR